jgi:D-alanyl-lipoteichoic acid acyltransferase DltB (MBOAT superfamily)
VVRRVAPALTPHLLVLVAAVFCLSAGPWSLAFLAGSLVGNYLVVRRLRALDPASAGHKFLLACAILVNVGTLATFKLAQEWADGAPGAAAVVLPLGLAFYTLQQITFLVDARRREVPMMGFVHHAAWGSFFAQLTAGPIGAWRRTAPQYARLGERAPAPADVARGAALVLLGFNKKLWLADPVGRIVDPIVTGAALGAVSPLEAWTAAWGYMLQLYFDFSAYSDIAIGAGLCLGLLLPVNFNSPLKSATPGQYVMRWHMSLMAFVRDYVFEPVFRLARRLPLQPMEVRYSAAWAVATLLSYLAVAAWHTVAIVPLLQGLAVAVLLIALQMFRQASAKKPRTANRATRAARRVGGQLLLLVGVSIFALMLRTRGEGALAQILPALVDTGGMAELWTAVTTRLHDVAAGDASQAWPGLYPHARLSALPTLAVMSIATGVALALPNSMQIMRVVPPPPGAGGIAWRPSAAWGATTTLLLFAAVVGLTRPHGADGFIYAQF